MKTWQFIVLVALILGLGAYMFFGAKTPDNTLESGGEEVEN